VATAAAEGNPEPAAAAAACHAAAVLLEYALADKRTKKLSKAAVGVAASCQWHPVLEALATPPAVAEALQEGPAGSAAADALPSTDSKRRKKSTPACYFTRNFNRFKSYLGDGRLAR